MIPHELPYWDSKTMEYDLPPELRRSMLDVLRENRKMLDNERVARTQEKKETRKKERELFMKNNCARCGSSKRNRDRGTRAGIFGQYCTDVMACEWDAWSLPCCQYCFEQFHPGAHTICGKAPVDPYGQQPHVAGGIFQTEEQKQERARDKSEDTTLLNAEITTFLDTEMRTFVPLIPKVHEFSYKYELDGFQIDKFDESIREEEIYSCSECGRVGRPTKPTSCKECSMKMGWRKGIGKVDKKR